MGYKPKNTAGRGVVLNAFCTVIRMLGVGSLVEVNVSQGTGFKVLKALARHNFSPPL